MKQQEFTFAEGRLTAIGASKKRVTVYVNDRFRVGHASVSRVFISISNFLFLLENPDARFDIEACPAHRITRRMPNGEFMDFEIPETFWVAVYKPNRF